MERSLIKEVNKKNMAARLNTRKVKPMLFPNFFTPLAKDTLKWETLVGEKGAPVVADVISYDASAPQKTREVIAKLSGDINKTAVKRGMNESDWNEYNRLSHDVGGNADQRQLLDLAFKDQDFVYNAVRARFEWWCMQMLSRGGYVLNSTNNNGIVTEEFVSCGMPKKNQMKAKVAWSDTKKGDALQDIEDVLIAANDAGVTINYILMSKADFSDLKKQDATIAKVKGWINQTTKMVITRAVINDYLAAQEYSAKIVLVEPRVKIEGKDHKKRTVNPWKKHHVTFLESLEVGNIQHGPIAAEASEEYKKKATTVKKDFIFITKWSELEPFKEWTKAEANAVPVVNDPDTLFILKSDAEAWEDVNTEYTDVSGEDVRPSDDQVADE